MTEFKLNSDSQNKAELFVGRMRPARQAELDKYLACRDALRKSPSLMRMYAILYQITHIPFANISMFPHDRSFSESQKTNSGQGLI